MKKSIYNYCTEYKDGEYIIFNTFNSSVLLLDNRHYKLYCSSTGESNDDELNDTMLKCGMLIEDSLDERSIVDFDRGFYEYNSGDQSSFKIFTTTECNARCWYCYEKGVIPDSMNLDTAKEVVRFIKHQSQKSKRIKIGWFGGEPLLNPDVIDYISKEINAYSSVSGIKWTASIITNGALFSDELIDKAKNLWKIKDIQITLDGTKQQYEQTKNYIDSSQFETVIDNIRKLIISGFSVSIRLNTSQKTYDNIRKLLYFLRETLRDCPTNWNVYAAPISDITNPTTDIELLGQLFELDSLIYRLHNNTEIYAPKLPQYLPSRCGNCSMHSHTILPNGDLIKCSRTINSIKPYGNVRDERILFNSSFTRMCSPSLLPKCQECIFLPLCQGGCRAEQILGGEGCPTKIRNIDLLLRSYIDSRKQTII